MSEEFVTYETLDEGRIARIMLNRPEARNAQNRGLLVELDEAFLRAEADDAVRVVILGGMGPMFSAGPRHGLEGGHGRVERRTTRTRPGWSTGAPAPGAEKRMLQEWHYYFENTRRWRNLRKITIAQVHGTVFAAGLMLMWACDLIVAADDVSFADVVGTRLGMCGVEYFAHPWEFGPRKTKELMLTGDSLDVDEAHRLGHGVQGLPGGRARRQDARVRPPDRRAADHDRPAHQGVGQPDGRQHGLLQRPQRLLHPPRAQPRPLGRGPRGGMPIATVEDGIADWRSAPPVQPALKSEP